MISPGPIIETVEIETGMSLAEILRQIESEQVKATIHTRHGDIVVVYDPGLHDEDVLRVVEGMRQL